jgi:hypothetical protein
MAPPAEGARADVVIIRTGRFALQMHASERAGEKRVAVDRAMPWLVANEEGAVKVLERELGIRWPEEPVVVEVEEGATVRSILLAGAIAAIGAGGDEQRARAESVVGRIAPR